MAEKKRYEYISDMKTLGVFGVLLGHCSLFYVGNPFFPESADIVAPFAVWLCTFFDAVLISSFLFCSGFLYANRIEKHKKTIPQSIKERAKRLLLPYYLYGAIWLVPLYTLFDIKSFGRPEHAGYLEGYKYMLLGVFSDHLWFLWLLFWVALFFILIKPIVTKKLAPLWMACALGMALIVQYLLVDFPYFKLSQTAPYFLSYGLGVLAFMYKEKISRLPRPLLFFMSAVCFGVCFLHNILGNIHFSLQWACKLCGALTGFFLFLGLEPLGVLDKLRATGFWKFTRYHSMRIYLLNCPVVYLFFMVLKGYIGHKSLLCVLVNFVMSTLTLYLMVWIQDIVMAGVKRMVNKDEKKR